MVKINRVGIDSVDLKLKVSREDAVLLLALTSVLNGTSGFVNEVYHALSGDVDLDTDAKEARKFLFEGIKKGGTTLDWAGYQRSVRTDA